MAPILLAVESDRQASTLDAAKPSDEHALTTCQICFDEIPVHQDKQANGAEPDATTEGAVVTAFCGPTCPVVTCRGCMAQHVHLSVTAAFPGVLPKVRCPVCLVQVNKARWQNIVAPEVVKKYVELCRTACSFRTPCCENVDYTHLPREIGATDLPARYRQLPQLKLEPELEAKLEALHERTRQFCEYEISAKDLIIFVEDTFGRHVGEATQLLIVEHELCAILDDERRAMVLLAYHAKYKVVKTRCCACEVCFNCKRRMSTHSTVACGTETLSTDSIVECRSCRVTMVKVEGCGSVRCWCGFAMDWSNEIRLRDRFKKGFIPVDLYDMKTYAAWDAWHKTFTRSLAKRFTSQKHLIRLRSIEKQLAHVAGLRKTLRKLVDRPYLWRGRFSKALPAMREEIVVVRMRLLAKRLKTHGSFLEAVGRAKWRGRFRRTLPETRDEIMRARMMMLTRRLKKTSGAFVVAVGRAGWYHRFARALPTLRDELRRVLMLKLARKLKKHGAILVGVGRAKWRTHFGRVLHQLDKVMYERRMAHCVGVLSKSALFVEAVRKAKWRACWTRVLKSVHFKRFWICYKNEHPEEQRVLRDEEMEMLLPSF